MADTTQTAQPVAQPAPMVEPLTPDTGMQAAPVNEDHAEYVHEISPEDRDSHVKALRDLAQNIRNKNDQDTNRIIDAMIRHLDALDGEPEKLRRAELRDAAERRLQPDHTEDRPAL